MKTKELLTKSYLSSYEKREGIFVIAVLAFALAMIIVGFHLPI